MQRKRRYNAGSRMVILELGLLEYLDKVRISKRNQDIVLRYAEGETFKALGKAYGISGTRIGQIVTDFIVRGIDMAEIKI